MQIPKRKPGKFTHLKNDPLVTAQKFEQLQADLKSLKEAARPALAAEVARLAELGDFSENAEYQLAKGRLRGVNNAILKLEARVRDAEVIEKKKDGVVAVGSEVVIEAGGKKRKYLILGSSETDPEQGIISYSSPLGAALLGKERGEEFVLKTGVKEIKYRIISVN